MPFPNSELAGFVSMLQLAAVSRVAVPPPLGIC